MLMRSGHVVDTTDLQLLCVVTFRQADIRNSAAIREGLKLLHGKLLVKSQFDVTCISDH